MAYRKRTRKIKVGQWYADLVQVNSDVTTFLRFKGLNENGRQEFDDLCGHPSYILPAIFGDGTTDWWFVPTKEDKEFIKNYLKNKDENSK